MGTSDIALYWCKKKNAGIEDSALKKALDLKARKETLALRQELEAKIAENPLFGTSLKPLPPIFASISGPINGTSGRVSNGPSNGAPSASPKGAPESPLIQKMLAASELSNTGPMAAVAGAIAQELGEKLLKSFPLEELVIENGGDLWFYTKSPLHIRIFAGPSPLSEKVAAILPAGTGGLACSSATVGHALSFGSSDAALIVHNDAANADALATALGNRIQKAEDLENAVSYFYNERFRQSGTRAALAIKGELLAAQGELELAGL